ncbi:SRPBCC domain-containing protein [Paenibacillus albicereus]|uniref:SRPBCC domain-containing protein n=1 Tax=Paenibacillus albicereus TaxID=2726185 RepID=A0A6H2H325_9BACL|nr:SRPBCC domain-containing protein [Paenibacillus albicereus]QJC53738.1 SRPBCC domain-containing protein [Paenibacillus albicereus]
MSLTLSMDFPFSTTIQKLWSALTDSRKLAKWVANIHTGEPMDNDFEAVVGRRFQFRTAPSQWWDGIISGEVLVVEEPTKLSYTWASGAEEHTVVWTLHDLGDGKVNLHLEQTGISRHQAVEGARYGWAKWLAELEKVVA